MSSSHFRRTRDREGPGILPESGELLDGINPRGRTARSRLAFEQLVSGSGGLTSVASSVLGSSNETAGAATLSTHTRSLRLAWPVRESRASERSIG